MRFRLFYVMLILGPRPGKVVRTTLPITLHLVATNLGDFALSFAVLPPPLSPEARTGHYECASGEGNIVLP